MPTIFSTCVNRKGKHIYSSKKYVHHDNMKVQPMRFCYIALKTCHMTTSSVNLKKTLKNKTYLQYINNCVIMTMHTFSCHHRGHDWKGIILACLSSFPLAIDGLFLLI